MKRIPLIIILCAFMCTMSAQAEVVRKLMVNLENGQTVSYDTEQIQSITFGERTTPPDDGKLTITVDDIGMDYFTFSIKTQGESYIFAAFETGYLSQYTEDYLLGITGHIMHQDNTYTWRNGEFFEFEDITVRPGHKYTILAAIWKGEGQAPDKIYRTDLTTVAESVGKGEVAVTVTDITSTSATVNATPDSSISEYIVFVKDKAWADNIVAAYGEALLQSTTERAVELGMARLYGTLPSSEVWTDLVPGTEHVVIVVATDNEGSKKMTLTNFTTAN